MSRYNYNYNLLEIIIISMYHFSIINLVFFIIASKTQSTSILLINQDIKIHTSYHK